MTARVLRIHPADDVAVALADLAPGEEVAIDGERVQCRQRIAKGHKLALRALTPGQPVLKYGWPIGKATAPIEPGTHVHAHNCGTGLDGELSYAWKGAPRPRTPRPLGRTWQGYIRADGRAGTRNELWIVPTVGCVNRTAEALARAAEARRFPGIDGVQALTHPLGCSQLGDDHAATRAILAALARHPNAGGVLVLGLGCENNHIAQFRPLLADADPARLRFLTTQEVGDEQESGMALLAELAAVAGRDRRVALGPEHLVVGLKCGGSDGFSGITANPLLGRLCDRVTDAGGSALLTEVPEMFGAETLLMDRCRARPVFEATVALINGFKRYFQRHGQVVYENPSPGNKEGGITTLEEKSLGCTQKGGDAVVVDVLRYGERQRTPGLSLLEGPGNDIVAVTALAAAGANVILFTTGRGTPLGGPVPTLKIATNADLARRKHGWIDFDAGALLAGEDPARVDERFLDLVLATASGQAARNERNGHREIALFKDGVTL